MEGRKDSLDCVIKDFGTGLILTRKPVRFHFEFGGKHKSLSISAPCMRKARILLDSSILIEVIKKNVEPQWEIGMLELILIFY